jgi:hypothetical protein
MCAEGKDYIIKDGDMLNFLFNVWFVMNEKTHVRRGFFFIPNKFQNS